MPAARAPPLLEGSASPAESKTVDSGTPSARRTPLSTVGRQGSSRCSRKGLTFTALPTGTGAVGHRREGRRSCFQREKELSSAFFFFFFSVSLSLSSVGAERLLLRAGDRTRPRETNEMRGNGERIA